MSKSDGMENIRGVPVVGFSAGQVGEGETLKSRKIEKSKSSRRAGIETSKSRNDEKSKRSRRVGIQHGLRPHPKRINRRDLARALPATQEDMNHGWTRIHTDDPRLFPARRYPTVVRYFGCCANNLRGTRRIVMFAVQRYKENMGRIKRILN